MFKKLVANLPFNPSLISEVSFYVERLKQESAIRRLSFLFIVGTMLVQMFAVISPPERSLAASANHIINGVQTRTDILNAWDQGDVAAIYGVFGVTRDDIAALPMNPNTTLFSGDGNDYWTIGRSSLLAYTNVEQQYKDSQITIQYAGQNSSTTSDDKFIYNRQLRAWDIVNRSGNYYKAFRGTLKSTGETFWILIDCGNFTKIGRYVPPPPPPPPPPPKNPITAVCSITQSIVLGRDDEYATIPVRITLPEGKSINNGSSTDGGNGGRGLHLGVTAKGSPSTWNVHDNAVLSQEPPTPPDKQTDYIPNRDGTQGLTYYDFVWSRDNTTYRRYFVTDSHSSTFDVKLRVRVNKLERSVVVRLLDRDLGQWLPHNESCEASVIRETPPPNPVLEVTKTIMNKKTSYKPGEELTYLIQYRNTINGSLAENVEITDQIDTRSFEVVWVTPTNTQVSNGFLKYQVGNLAFSNTAQSIQVTVKIKDQVSSGSTICNASRMTASNASAVESNVCTGVITPCPYDDNVADINNPNCAQPTIICSAVDAVVNRTTRNVTFKTTVTSSNPAATTVQSYKYDFGDETPVVTHAGNGFTDEVDHQFKAGDFTTKVVVTYTAKGLDGPQQAECSVPISFEEDQVLGQAKTVRNITRDKTGDAAIETTVKPNDVLEYTLTTSNAQNYERVGIEVSDYIGDLLDYAALDTAFLKEQGGKFDEKTQKIVWEKVKITANGEVEHLFRVKVKEPIPSTNSPSSVSTTFDCKISNKYGNEITINVDCPLVKGVETLPNTGPGASLFMTFGITTIVGYFFARSRLLAKELSIVKTDFASHGGM